ncbi:MAG: hypothetical protein IKN82_05495 [Treponema sp.]|nr:hypothetical protein [Treponema sp.]
MKTAMLLEISSHYNCRQFVFSSIVFTRVLKFIILKFQLKLGENMLEELKQPIAELKENILNVWGRL